MSAKIETEDKAERPLISLAGTVCLFEELKKDGRVQKIRIGLPSFALTLSCDSSSVKRRERAAESPEQKKEGTLCLPLRKRDFAGNCPDRAASEGGRSEGANHP